MRIELNKPRRRLLRLTAAWTVSIALAAMAAGCSSFDYEARIGSDPPHGYPPRPEPWDGRSDEPAVE